MKQEHLVEIKGLILDPVSNTPIVILKKAEENVLLPIWIGVFEANAIAIELEGVQTPRPMSHDLMRALVEALHGVVEEVVVHSLVENTFHATVHLRTSDGERVEVDARPSDAIALALRARAPIKVTEQVFQQAHALEITESSSEEDRLRQWLESLSPEDIGKYKM